MVQAQADATPPIARENLNAYRVFQLCRIQFQTTMAAVIYTGIDMTQVKTLCEPCGVPFNLDLIAKIRVMESAALKVLNATKE